MILRAEQWLILRMAGFRRGAFRLAYGLVGTLLVFLNVIWQPLTTVAETAHTADSLREAELSLHAANRLHHDDGEHASSPDDAQATLDEISTDAASGFPLPMSAGPRDLGVGRPAPPRRASLLSQPHPPPRRMERPPQLA